MRQTIKSPNAPMAIGPYSHAILAEGKFLFISEMIPMNLEGDIAKNDIVAQTEQCVKNIQAILEEAGASLEDVVKVSVFLKDFADFPVFNNVYADFFHSNKPARTTIEVLGLPKGALVAMDAIAVIDK